MGTNVRKIGNVLAWGVEGIDEKAIEQAMATANLPFVKGHLALMPDAHWGMGSTIGSVIPTKGAIIPAAVGVDIGCGMIAAELEFSSEGLPDSLDDLLDDIARRVPAGVGQGHDNFKVAKTLHKLGEWRAPIRAKANKSARQMGTLGSGNHFIEICLDERDVVWVVLHSGSRGIGNMLARYHIDVAKSEMKEHFITLEDQNLAYLVQHSKSFEDYIFDLRWAQEYAFQNRETMMRAVLEALGKCVHGELWAGSLNSKTINCHHNYTEQENHHGKNMWITRKGAIRARVGELGVIPGSMGTDTFIVEGLGNPASYESAPHGAGRRMSRTEARKTLDLETLDQVMEGKAWNQDAKGLIDEDPRAYKDIHDVMRISADLVKPVHHLRQILNFKGN